MVNTSLFSWDIVNIEVPTKYGNEKLFIWSQPDLSDLEELVFENFRDFFKISNELNSYEEIWIKPNITGINRPEEGKTTQPKILDIIINVLRQFTNKKIIVADSSVIGIDTNQAAQITGIIDICDKYNVPFVNLREVEFKKVKVNNHLIHETLDVATPFIDNKIYKINLAKIKTTYGSPIGIGVKNTKGVITDELKYCFHIKGLQKSICDLYEAVNWNLTIVEGFPISELGEPGGIAPFLISTNPIINDYLICLVFKVPLQDVFHIEHLGARIGLTESFFINNKQIKQIIDLYNKIKYTSNGLQILAEKYKLLIENGDACSGCIESLTRALKSVNQRNLKNKRIIIGAQFKDTLVNNKLFENTDCFTGNCSFDRVGIELVKYNFPADLYELWHNSIKIQGCPPTIDDMSEILSDIDKDDSKSEKNKSKRIESAFVIRPLQISQYKENYNKILKVIPTEAISFGDFGLEKMIAGEVISAAICHQINWDFLRKAIYNSFANGDEWWKPQNLKYVSERQIFELLANYDKKERIKAKERSEMIVTLSNMFDNNVISYIELFHFNTNNSIILSNLLKAKAFSEDPEQKKLQVLLHNIARENIINNIDDLCRPAIDYHIMRLYIRRGDIAANSAVGYDFLQPNKQRKSTTVAAFRSIIAEALNYSSFITGIKIPFINNIDWWIGRSVCLKDKPNCSQLSTKSEWLKSLGNECPFIKYCYAYNHDRKLMNFQEPQHVGRFY